MKHRYFVLPLIFLLLLPSTFAGYFDDWYEWLHVPPEYTKPPNLLHFLILPFLGVFVIVWGILTRINIFEQGRVNMLLSLIFALSLVYYGHLFKIVHFLFSAGSFFAFLAYIFLFFSGIWLFSKRKVKGDWKSSELKELKQVERELKEARESLRDINRRLARETDKDRIDKLNTNKDKIEGSIGKLEGRIDKLRGEIKIEKDSE